MTHLRQIARRILLEQDSSAGRGLLFPDSPMGMLFVRMIEKPLNLREAADAVDEAYKNVLERFKESPGRPFTQKEVDAYEALSRFVGSAEANAFVAQLTEEREDAARKWEGITTSLGMIGPDEVRDFLEAAKVHLELRGRGERLDKSALFTTAKQAEAQADREAALAARDRSGLERLGAGSAHPLTSVMDDEKVTKKVATATISNLVSLSQDAKNEHEKKGLELVSNLISRATYGNDTAAEQIAAAENARTAWLNYRRSVISSPDAEPYIEFLLRSVERLKAGKAIFPYLPSPLQDSAAVQDAGWRKYLAGNKARQVVWDAWSTNRKKLGFDGPEEMSFNSYVMWWKDASRKRSFSDGRKGSIDATVQLLRKEARLPPEGGT